MSSPAKNRPWRAFNPGSLKKGAEKARADRVIPLHARPIKG
ncbi:hypothetical protein BCL79_0643 [Stenotrophomonas rhizophila]|uniref:Uncharacterized protein n=1 Tax=Stenotrophomonas rhizophila TaxID=216778 RepID=A0A498CEC4_9GAMM|nr:hypothetical protein [Stenotrophomonas rhizophila]RLK56259.1 hypothetical protein BCL79_0643 [Stenotrophomonas rhizophila]